MLADFPFVEVRHECGAVGLKTSYFALDASIGAVPNFASVFTVVL